MVLTPTLSNAEENGLISGCLDRKHQSSEQAAPQAPQLDWNTSRQTW